MNRTLFVSDLDGTLLGPDSHLSARTIEILNHAISRGALITAATARTPATLSYLLEEVDFKIPLVVMTGAALWDKNTRKYSDVQNFTPEKVREIIRAYQEPEGGGGFLYTLRPHPPGRDIMEIYHIGPLNNVEREFMLERLDSPYKRFYVPASGMSKIPDTITDAVLFFGMKQDVIANQIRERLEKIEGINPMFYHDWHAEDIAEVEAFPEGATKAKAILRLKERVGADRVVVFGDNFNDLSMMSIADHSVAVANALPEVKKAADEVIGSNKEDAVARYILERLTD